MFKILSDLSLILRKDLPVADVGNSVLASGVQGSWVTYVGSNVELTTSATRLAWPVFNESNRDGTVGWTPDVTNSLGVTVLAGKWWAQTDQYTGTTPVVGNALSTTTGGKLTITGGTGTVDATSVAFCSKAPVSISYFSRTVTVIEIYAI